MNGTLEAGADFVAALAECDLPGNARQLENIVRCAIVRKDGDSPLGLRDLPPEIWSHVSELGLVVGTHLPAAASMSAVSTSVSQADPAPLIEVLTTNGWNLSRSLASCEKALLEAALQATRGNQSETARLLGITPRCIYNKLRRHRILRPSA